MSALSASSFAFPVRRWQCLALALLLVLPPVVAKPPLDARVPASAPQPRELDDARGYLPIHHPLRSTGGMVVSQSRPASEVGVQILRAGGNAIDAAVAVGLAEAVTLPRAGNLGGGGAMVIYLAKEHRTTAFDYYGSAPAATTPGLLLGADGKRDREASRSWKSIAVPGTVAAFAAAQRRYGKLRWAQVVAPAIALAEQGVRLSDDEARVLDWAKPSLARTPETRAQFFKADGSSYAAGALLKQPDLAWSLRQIAGDGADAFYKGEIAKRIVAASQQHGGILTAEDLANYQVRELAPVHSSYRGVPLALAPEPASGTILAELLNLIERVPLSPADAGSAKAYHLIAEATRLADADRKAYAGGTPQAVSRSAGLLDKAYAARRAALISLAHTLPAAAVDAGDPRPHESPDTTHYSVVDADGNAVANTYTLSNNFGAGVIAAGTGILLNNSMVNFAWDGPADSPNAPAPGKRLVSTISPFIAFKDGKPWIVAGTPGAESILSALAQFVVNVVDFKLTLAEAVARPRINAYRDGGIAYEQGISPDTLERLQALGHALEPSITQTSIQAIELAADGSAFGAADPRRPDSAAVGVHEYR
ncbi:gamma-glutamyltransferase [Xanthomonas maliensis]|uniref:gamma-glutamyltransferase n=1 Tax=Xanthomonas maliensis TaxID=1321368 RepID=UPI00039C5CB6|nr:gamma-glutamyltransferase [Xanthomonas maliensis]KAB7772578.1 gamma-glutamyltransferase [Xanthomonas maliensis]